MSDIFRIKDIDIKLEFQGVQYPFVDPVFPKKVNIRRDMGELGRKREASEISVEDFAMAMYEINKRMIKLHVPDLPDTVLDSLGEHKMLALLESITELGTKNFGAVIEKVEKKS